MAKSKTEQRAEDQDSAIERAFVAGTLPEEDRRTPEEVAADINTETLALLESAEIGSTFSKERGGWRVTYVKNGTPLFLSGPDIPAAFASHGLHITPPTVAVDAPV